MPKTWGLSKGDAGYKPAPKLEVRCDVCAFMFPRMAIGSCKYVRGAIRRGVHVQRVRSSHRCEDPSDWSRSGDSNPGPTPYHGVALPLSYSGG